MKMKLRESVEKVVFMPPALRGKYLKSPHFLGLIYFLQIFHSFLSGLSLVFNNQSQRLMVYFLGSFSATRITCPFLLVKINKSLQS